MPEYYLNHLVASQSFKMDPILKGLSAHKETVA